MKIRFHLDEQVSPAVAVALRIRGVDVTISHEVGLIGATDDEQLRFVRAEGRALFTHDRDFLALVANNFSHSGVVYCHQDKYSIGALVHNLLLLHGVYNAEDLHGRVEYL